MKAFINYRRDDSRDWANLLSEAISRQFGAGAVFLDADNIRASADWTETISESLGDSEVLIIMVGPKWLFLQNPEDGRRRLDVDDDWVRREIEISLKTKKLILPVLVSAKMPRPSSLPKSIRAISKVQGLNVDNKEDLDRVLNRLEEIGFKRVTSELSYPVPVVTIPELVGEDFKKAMLELAQWNVEHRQNKKGKQGKSIELVRTYVFKSFRDAVHFIATSSRAIHSMQHHPAWENQYKELRVRLTTWDIGMRPTAKDIQLARYFDHLYMDYVTEKPAEKTTSLAPT